MRLSDYERNDTQAFQEFLEIGTADAQNGALFKAAQPQPVSNYKKCIIIGVGGTGVQTINNIKRSMELKYIDWRSQIAFLAVDTDFKEIKQTAFAADETVNFAFSGNSNFNSIYCNGPQKAPDYTAKWMNPHFQFKPSTTGLPGAGQTRQYCRILLYDPSDMTNPKDEKIINSIRKAHDAIHSPGTQDQDYNVYIILGVAGGTGSGAIVDIAHFAKTAIPGCSTTGFFLMPDVADTVTRSKLTNGYAALKELDYYYSSRQRERDEIDSLGYSRLSKAPKEYSKNYRLYDEAFIVSGSNGNVTTDCFRRATQTVSEAILNLLADSDALGQKQDGTGLFLWDSFLSNKQAERNNVMQILFREDGKQEEQPGAFADDVFDYNAVGVGTAALPEKALKSYVVKGIMRKVVLGNHEKPEGFQGFKEDALAKNEALNWIKSFSFVTANDLAKKTVALAKELSFWREDAKKFNKKQIIAAGAKTSATKCLIEPNRDAASQKLSKMIASYLEEQLKAFKTRARKFLEEYGPKAFSYVYKGISDDGSKYTGLQDQISTNKSILVDNLPQTINLADKEEEFDTVTNKLKGLLGGARGVLGATGDWHTSFEEYSAMKVASEVAETYLNQNQYYKEYLKYIEQFAADCEDFATVLDALVINYENLGKGFEDFVRFRTEASKENYTNINIVSDQSDYNWVRRNAEACIEAADIQGCKKKLIESFIDHREGWTQSDSQNPDINPRTLFDNIMSDYVKKLDESLSFTNVIKYRMIGEQPDDKAINIDQGKLNDAVTNLVESIYAQAKPLYRVNQTYAAYAQGREVAYLLVPATLLNGENGASFADAFTNACAQIGNIQMVRAQGIENKVVCYRFSVAMPLYGLRDIDEWQREYVLGLPGFFAHSNESGEGDYNMQTGLAWENYPEICRQRDPRNELVNGKISSEGRFLREQLDPLFKLAEEYGIIEKVKDDGTNLYSYVYYDIIQSNWDYTIDKKQYPKEGDYYPLGKALVQYLATKNETALDSIKKPVILQDQGRFSDPQVDPEIALDYAKRSLRKNVPMFLKVKKAVRIAKSCCEQLIEENKNIRREAISKLVPRSIACGILCPDQYRYWQLQNWPIKGNKLEVVQMMGAKLEDDKYYRAGLKFEVLIDRFRRVAEESSLETLKEYIDSKWDEINNDKSSRKQKDGLSYMDEFKKEVQDFLKKCNGPNRIPEINTIKEELGITQKNDAEFDRILNHYNQFRTVYNQLVEAIEIYSPKENNKSQRI